MSQALTEFMKERRSTVEAQLEKFLELGDDCPSRLLEAMHYSLLAPAKRLRPILVLLAVEACGGRETDGYPAACAVEMIHTYSLIHDDLPAMDDDDLRRGLPTCHKKFGEAMAILAGDGLLTLAFQVLADNYPPGIASGCVRELASGAGAQGMVGGQVEDLAWERALGKAPDAGEPSLAILEGIHARKTGALFRASLRLGVWAAQVPHERDADSQHLACLDAYGRCLGQAFQITDDLLDVEGNAEVTGKRVQKDAARGKLTYPALLGTAESRRRAERLCQQACEHLSPFGPKGDRLRTLVSYILERRQ